jgi:hypothetical protein
MILRSLAFLAGLAASTAYACPVCFSAKDEAQRQAFFDTTIFLTLLPLLMIGGVIFWVARRSRQLDAEDKAARAESEPRAASVEPEPSPGSLGRAAGR